MFEKLTSREKKLAIAVLALVPICIVFAGVFWFIGKWGDNFDKTNNLITSISTEKDKMRMALEANRRRIYYGSVSMPSDLNLASNEYQVWLKQLLKKHKLEMLSIQPRDSSTVKYDQKVVGVRKTFQLNTRSTLKQLTEFLGDFESTDLLHRINSMKISPETTVAGKNKRVRSGRLTVGLTIEILSMAEAENREDFLELKKELPRPFEEFQDKIVKRNLFGPANNTPVISARASSYYADARISVSAKDADENDLLSFEVVESAIEGVKLEQRKPTDRRATLTIPLQEPGKFDVKLRVVDNGFPPKEDYITLSVPFKEKPVRPIPKKDPPPPPFIQAKATKITAIVRERTGDWQVWIIVGPTGKKHFLNEGESFDLDDKKWIIQSIEPEQVLIGVDDKTLTFFEGDMLGSPRIEVTNKPTARIDSDLPPIPRVVSEP